MTKKNKKAKKRQQQTREIISAVIALIIGISAIILFLLVKNWDNIFQDDTSMIKCELQDSCVLSVGQTGYIGQEDIKLKLKEITEDSRCPEDVVCIWEGQVTVLINVMQDNQDLGDLSLTLRAGHSDIAKENIAGYEFEIKEVTPYPGSWEAKESLDYEVTLVVDKSPN